MDDIVAIALFRHGMTMENKRQAYLGWTDSPLVPGQVFPEILEDFDRIYTSDLGRCRETAKVLFPNKTAEVVPELREMSFGEWEGKTYEQLKNDVIYQKWLDEPFRISPPNGESFFAFTQRVNKGWGEITGKMIEHRVKTSALVTHGGVIRYLLTAYSPEKRDFWEWSIPYGRGYQLTWSREGLRRGERCISLREVPLMENQNGSGSNIS
ncbi:histidine phosphatase family protein [Mesobacillus jeotgali]|uniref:histidine phosphatase family protein n=1 Tax=Mesobacillus jeotgali TaxID=129985 RepID=UPI0009A587BD|nr:histidine phosphatase family protein [Mesobacillus jeotgali]